MSDYKESTVTGKKWQRSAMVVISNPLNMPELGAYGAPVISFHEEEIISTGTSYVINPLASVGCAFDPANTLHQDIYSKLNELYVLLRTERDAAQEAQP